MTTPTVTSNMAAQTNPGRMASVDFSETCRSMPTDPRRLHSSQRENKLLKPWQPWLAVFGIASYPGSLCGGKKEPGYHCLRMRGKFLESQEFRVLLIHVRDMCKRLPTSRKLVTNGCLS